MKRMLCLVLCALLCAPLLAGSASAANLSTGQESIVAAGATSYFVDENHVLWGWGNNTVSQLGNGKKGDLVQNQVVVQTTPVKLLDGVKSVASSGMHTLAVKTDGTLWVWGLDSHGQLGIGKTEDHLGEGWGDFQAVPVKLMDGVAAAAAADDYSLILKTDGTLWACGAADYLGNGNRGDLVNPDVQEYDIDGKLVPHYLQTTPVKILDGVSSMCAGSKHAFAIKTDGTLWGWGENWQYCLGVGQYAKRLDTPQKVMDGVRSVSTSDCHTLAVKTDGTLWAWGENNCGQLGSGEAQDMSRTLIQEKPVKIMEGVAAACAAGHESIMSFLAPLSYYSLALKTDGTLWAWGANDYGQLGNGGKSNFTGAFYKSSTLPSTLPAQNTPVRVLDGVAEISAANFHVLVRKTDGTVWGWGQNANSELGNGRAGNAKSETELPYQTLPTQIPLSQAGAAVTKPQNLLHRESILVDGQRVEMDSYLFQGNNYLKLRDLAAALSGTAAQFNVGWNGTTGTVEITTGRPYTPVGGEGTAGFASTATPSAAKLTVDGKNVPCAAYQLSGNNYLKLRDVAAAVGFAVEYDGATQTVTVDTSKGYTAPQ